MLGARLCVRVQAARSDYAGADVACTSISGDGRSSLTAEPRMEICASTSDMDRR